MCDKFPDGPSESGPAAEPGRSVASPRDSAGAEQAEGSQTETMTDGPSGGGPSDGPRKPDAQGTPLRSAQSYGKLDKDGFHVAPEAHAGGPLAVVRDGDIASLDVEARSLTLEIDEAELAARMAEWKASEPEHERGWHWLYVNNVMRAREGADFGFLRGRSGSTVKRESH